MLCSSRDLDVKVFRVGGCLGFSLYGLGKLHVPQGKRQEETGKEQEAPPTGKGKALNSWKVEVKLASGTLQYHEMSCILLS